jgi:hypothetical protein
MSDTNPKRKKPSGSAFRSQKKTRENEAKQLSKALLNYVQRPSSSAKSNNEERDPTEGKIFR